MTSPTSRPTAPAAQPSPPGLADLAIPLEDSPVPTHAGQPRPTDLGHIKLSVAEHHRLFQLARAKAAAVARSVPGRLVLGADQTLARGNKRFSKPANRAAAAEQLRALRGRTHELHSALALVRDGAVLFDCVDSARLTMRKISDRFIDDYLDMAGTAALASVGAYQLEGIGIHLFERVEGDYSTILGLPLLPLLAYLRQNGLIDG